MTPKINVRRTVTVIEELDAPCGSCEYLRVGVMGTPYCGYQAMIIGCGPSDLESLEKCPKDDAT